MDIVVHLETKLKAQSKNILTYVNTIILDYTKMKATMLVFQVLYSLFYSDPITYIEYEKGRIM